MNKANGGYHILDMSSFPAITLTGVDLEDKAINEIKEAFDEFDKPVVIHGLKYKDEENYIHIMPDSFVDRSEWLDGDSYVMPLYIKIASDSVSQMVVSVAKAAKTISYSIVEAQTGGSVPEDVVLYSKLPLESHFDPQTMSTVISKGLTFTIATGASTAAGVWVDGETTSQYIDEDEWVCSSDNAACYIVNTECAITDVDAGLNVTFPNYQVDIGPSKVAYRIKISAYSYTLSKDVEYSVEFTWGESGDTVSITRITSLT